MYEAFFGLTRRPFSTVLSPTQFFPAESVEEAREVLLRVLERGEGVGVLMGPPGCGKSMLLRRIAADAAAEMDVVLLGGFGAAPARKELLQTLLFELELPFRGLDEGELRLALLERLLTRGEENPPVALFVDEAHHLAPLHLDELRQLSDVQAGDGPRLRIVLAGGAPLEELLATPALEALSQRVAARCYLQPWSRLECSEFVRRQVALAGGRDELFSPTALENLYRAGDGVPRLVGQLADLSLVLAARRRHGQVSGELVEEAWGELQQLPAPWSPPRRAASPTVERPNASARGGIVEFGDLVDLSALPDFAGQAAAADMDISDFGDLPEESSLERPPVEIHSEVDAPEVELPSAPTEQEVAAAARAFTAESAETLTGDAGVEFDDEIELPCLDAEIETEEVVHDRWSALENSLGRIRPIVRPVVLPQRLPSAHPLPAPPAIHQPEPAPHVEVPLPVLLGRGEDSIATIVTAPQSDLPPLHLAIGSSPLSESESEAAAELGVGPQSIVLHPQAVAESSGVLGTIPLRAVGDESCDRFDLVIEDDADSEIESGVVRMALPTPAPAAPVRKPEFRRMFARLLERSVQPRS